MSMIPPMPIASEFEGQTAKTAEISRNVCEAARGANEITENISEVTQTASDTSNVIGQTQSEPKVLEKCLQTSKNWGDN
jgi:methyl-accepting chemotaxis protein